MITRSDIKFNTIFFVELPILAFGYSGGGSSYILQAVNLLNKPPNYIDELVHARFIQLLKEFFPRDINHPVIEDVWKLTYEAR